MTDFLPARDVCAPTAYIETALRTRRRTVTSRGGEGAGLNWPRIPCVFAVSIDFASRNAGHDQFDDCRSVQPPVHARWCRIEPRLQGTDSSDFGRGLDQGLLKNSSFHVEQDATNRCMFRSVQSSSRFTPRGIPTCLPRHVVRLSSNVLTRRYGVSRPEQLRSAAWPQIISFKLWNRTAFAGQPANHAILHAGYPAAVHHRPFGTLACSTLVHPPRFR